MITSLPTAIFSIFQEYLLDHDYRNFMNCNQHDFQSIKYETVYFILTITNNEHVNTKYQIALIDDPSIEEQFVKFDKLVSKVKDKSKQIGLIMKKIPFLPKYYSKVCNIHFLEVLGAEFPEDYDFSIFNNIHHVTLNEVVHQLSGLSNIQELTLFDSAPDVVNIDSKNIRKINIAGSYISSSTISISFLYCTEISFNEVELGETFQLLPGVPYRSIRITPSDLIPLSIFNHCDLTHLQSLEISDLDLRTNNDFHMFSHINRLSLSIYRSHLFQEGSATELSYGTFINFENFYGKYLKLYGFDVTSWKSAECLPNVQEIDLSHCKFIDTDCPFLHNVRIITLSGMKLSLQKLIIFPLCTHLSLFEMENCISIDPQPKLKVLHLEDCRHISSIQLIPKQILQNVTIINCSQFHFTSVKNCRFLSIRSSTSLPAVVNIWNTQDPDHNNHVYDDNNNNNDNNNQKKEEQEEFLISTERMNVLIAPVAAWSDHNFINLKNIQYLEITVFIRKYRKKHLKESELTGIHNIPIVSIIDTNGSLLTSLENMKNIPLLKLQNLKKLSKVSNLKNIHTIMISNCETDLFHVNLFDHCCIIYSHNNPNLNTQAKLYSEGNTQAMRRNYLQVLSTIQEFYVVSKLENSSWPNPSLLPPCHVTRLW